MENSTVKTQPLQRPLGPQEVLVTELVRRCHGGIQLVTLAKFAKPVPVESCLEALEKLHERHPVLRARIEGREAYRWVCDVPFEDIEITLETANLPVDLSSVYTSCATPVLDVMTRSWRATLFTDAQEHVAWFALVNNHGAFDGRSVLVLLNDLDRYLCGTADLAQSLKLTPSLEQGLAAAGLAGDRSLFPAWPAETAWPTLAAAPAEDRHPRALLRIFPPERLTALHDRLKTQRLHLASGFVAAAYLASRIFSRRTEITGVVAPTDARMDCVPQIPGNVMGEFVAGINLLFGKECTVLEPIEIAREAQRQLTANRPGSLLMDCDVSLKTQQDIADQMAAASADFVGGICVTDVGDLLKLSGRNVGFDQIMMMPSQNHGIHPVMVAVVSTQTGICLTFGYSEPMQDRATVEGFADCYLDALDTLAEA